MTKNLVINASFAAALRRGKSRESVPLFIAALERAQKERKVPVFHRMLQRAGLLAGMYRRGPKPGVAAGFDIVYVEMSSQDGSLNVFAHPVDKRGESIAGEKTRLLMHVTQHAVESMFQRLRTMDRNVVLEELKPAACWLAQNRHVVAMEEGGVVLTPLGAFPVLRADGFMDDELDGWYHWDATTWIADTGLEDHTPQKKRLAVAVKRARVEGETYVKL